MANPKLVLRSVDVWAMYGLSNLPPFSVAGSVGILAAVNREQGSNILARQVTFGSLTVSQNDTLFNTSVVLTAVDGQGFKGTYTFRYNRVDLSVAFQGKDMTLPGSFPDVFSALSAINTKFGVALEQRDVINSAIAVPGGTITVRTKPTSFYYNSGTEIVLNAPVPLATAAPATNLSGFDPA